MLIRTKHHLINFADEPVQLIFEDDATRFKEMVNSIAEPGMSVFLTPGWMDEADKQRFRRACGVMEPNENALEMALDEVVIKSRVQKLIEDMGVECTGLPDSEDTRTDEEKEFQHKQETLKCNLYQSLGAINKSIANIVEFKKEFREEFRDEELSKVKKDLEDALSKLKEVTNG
jgi:hypothetical protein